MTDYYQEIIIDEAKNPSHFGYLKKFDQQEKMFNSSCGDIIDVQVILSTDKKKLEKLAWTGEGCTISMATMSLLAQDIEGKKVADILKYDQKNLLELLGLKEITPGRIKCLHIGLNAVKKAIE